MADVVPDGELRVLVDVDGFARLDIQLRPTGMVFEASERLILKIGGGKLGVPAMGHLPNEPTKNRGKHIVHVGGKSSSPFQFSTTEA